MRERLHDQIDLRSVYDLIFIVPLAVFLGAAFFDLLEIKADRIIQTQPQPGHAAVCVSDVLRSAHAVDQYACDLVCFFLCDGPMQASLNMLGISSRRHQVETDDEEAE